MKYIRTDRYDLKPGKFEVWDATGNFCSLESRYSPQEYVGRFPTIITLFVSDNYGICRTYHEKHEYLWYRDNKRFYAACLEPHYTELDPDY